MVLRILSIFLILTLTTLASAHAQVRFWHFGVGPNGGTSVPLVRNSRSLQLPWCGGFNMPQFAEIRLPNKSSNTLLAYDRSSSHLTAYTFTNGTWVYDPATVAQVPLPNQWMRFGDWNGDGLPDLFTHSLTTERQTEVSIFSCTPQGAYVYTDSLYKLVGNRRERIVFNPADVPAIGDFDGDGDADILYAPFGQLTLSLLKNETRERATTYPCFVEVAACAGGIASTVVCGTYNAAVCRVGAAVPQTPLGLNHLGAALSYEDGNGDGIRDLFHGDIGCNSAYYFQNLGTNMAPRFNTSPTIQPAAFSAALTLPTFPLTNWLDADQDGDKDMVLTSNELNYNDQQVNTIESAMLYRNASGTYTKEAGSFLQGQMLDLGVNAQPFFYDIDADGDVDMLVSWVNRSTANPAIFEGAVALLRNTGTRTAPAFTLETTDWLALKQLGLINLQLSFGDLTQDGKPDLLVIGGNYQTGVGTASIFINQAANAIVAPLFTLSARQFLSISNLRAESPAIADLDNDGDNDLLLGRADGNVVWFRNNGQSGSFAFQALGPIAGLRLPDAFNVKVALGQFDNDNTLDLVLTDYLGSVRWFPDIRSWIGTGAPSPIDVQFQPDVATAPVLAQVGLAPAPTFADLDGDANLDLALGTVAGGVQLFRNVSGLVSLGGHQTMGKMLTAYPNPTDQKVVVNASATDLHWYNAVGQEVYPSVESSATEPAENSTWNLGALKPGVYFCKSANGTAKILLIQ